MRKNNSFIIIIESGLTLLYLYIVLFSIIIYPLNLILGIFCILWLPGKNLLKLIKPKSTLVEKLGLTVILSIAFDNVVMFFYYISLYNVATTSENPVFFFDEKLLLILILFLNLFFILLNEFINFRSVETKKTIKDELRRSFKINHKLLLVSLGFVLSLISMIISTLYSRIPNYAYSKILAEYSLTFTFFNRVPLIFYLFLASSIICLIYIMFFTKNQYIILFSISAFIYCLWILPYVQISNYFSWDSYLLARIYNNYLNYGIRSVSNYPFIIKISTFETFRYSTSLFTSILLVSVTNLNINAVLWYIYPLILIFIPFLFYSIFHKYSIINEKRNLPFLIILTFLAILSPIFLKYAHSATTGVIGAIVFIILVVEFFDLINNRKSNFKIRRAFYIIFLYFFLCITRFEEAFYFLSLIFLYLIYFAFFESRKSKSKYTFNSSSSSSIDFEDKINTENAIKRFLLFIGVLLIVLSIIFYISLEFFGSISYFFSSLISENSILNNFYDIYINTKINLPLLGGNFQLNFYIVGILISGIILFLYFCYFSLFKYNYILLKISNIFESIIKKFHKRLKKFIVFRNISIAIYFLLFSVILIIELYFISFLQEEGIFLIIEIILNYSIWIFQSILFVKGLYYYKFKDNKQNYFFLTIIATSTILATLFLTGNILLAYYILNARFFTYFILFNLVIIQNTYFKEFFDKKKEYQIIIICLLLLLGTFFSLRKLAWG